MYNKFRKLIILLFFFKNDNGASFQNLGMLGKVGAVGSVIGLMASTTMLFLASSKTDRNHFLTKLTLPISAFYFYNPNKEKKASNHEFFLLFRKSSEYIVNGVAENKLFNFAYSYFFQGGLTFTGGILILIDYILKNK